ncbi:MAG: hypothetical protein ACTHM6_16370 [Tepidisphaeraceae bacterium]
MATLVTYTNAQLYDQLVERHQLLKIHCLNKLLKHHQLSAEARRRIIRDLMFDEGYFFDACWIRHSNVKQFSLLCYGEKEVHPDEDHDDLSRVLLPNGSDEMHDRVLGIVNDHFDVRGESVSGIDCGDR